jgi:hypothetical protein
MHLDTFSDADNPNFQELVGVGDLVTFLNNNITISHRLLL